jgi:hypothetical protein
MVLTGKCSIVIIHLSVRHCIVCHSIYGVWLSLKSYFQTVINQSMSVTGEPIWEKVLKHP